MKLLGKTSINGKQFTEKDSRGKVYRKDLGLDDTFYGGMVKEFYTTDYGIYMCLNKKGKIIDLGYNELTEKGKELLEGKKRAKPEPKKELEQEPNKELEKEPNKELEKEPAKEPDKDSEKVDRKALLAEAKALGIEGKLAIMKTNELITKIKEAKGDKEDQDSDKQANVGQGSDTIQAG
jgi:hypothetical protein